MENHAKMKIGKNIGIIIQIYNMWQVKIFKIFLKELDELKQGNYESVLIVAHGGVSKSFSGYFEEMWDGKSLNRGLKNCKIKEYEL